MDEGLILVLDVGKTSAKLIVTEAATGLETWRGERLAAPVNGQLDIGGIEAWIRSSLPACPERRRVRAIVPVAHGAAAVLLAANGAVLAAPDYEDGSHNAYDDAYDALRDPFEITFSPRLPQGLNLGRQIYSLSRACPALFAHTRYILPYPQYWAYLFSGIMAAEVTSLGTHTDLWQPASGLFSPVADSQGWTALFPPLRSAQDVLGPIRPELADAVGLDPACKVFCGLHDSNASFLNHRAHRSGPFAVVSSGTWTVAMSAAADLSRLDPARDMLASVDAFGMPAGAARFMGGREYAAIAGPSPQAPTLGGVSTVLDQGIVAWPAFAAGGPFQGRRGRIAGPTPPNGEVRASLATIYVALVTDVMLSLLDVRCSVIVDGPLAANPLFAPLLAALRPDASVTTTASQAGTVGGARWLVRGAAEPAPDLYPAVPSDFPKLIGYRDLWRTSLLMPDASD